MLTAYFDESYNQRTFCVGGWLATEAQWKEIETAWSQRIDYEGRISVRRGLGPISRYHATDCASLKREFSGWTAKRQILFTKKLIQIIGRQRPVCAFVFGASLDQFAAIFPHHTKNMHKNLYYMCLQRCLNDVTEIIQKYFPNDRVRVVCEHGELSVMAQKAFDSVIRNIGKAKYFRDISTAGRDCVPLQAADLIAYEGLKRLDGNLRGDDRERRSLQKLLGQGIGLYMGRFSEDTFKAWRKAMLAAIREKSLNKQNTEAAILAD